MTTKTYVLDTNILLDDPKAISSFEDNDVIIPLVVIEEIDRFKDKPGELGANAREFSRQLNSHIKNGGNLREGVGTAGGGRLIVYTMSDLKDYGANLDELTELDDYRGGDNKIVQVCIGLNNRAKHQGDISPILVTRDIQLRVKCNALRIPCEDRRKRGVASSVGKLYRGVRHVNVDSKMVQALNSKNAREQMGTTMNGLLAEGEKKFYPNEYAICKAPDGTELNKILRKRKGDQLPNIVNVPRLHKLQARNTEQRIALDMMLDPDIKLVTIIGKAGTGKTLLAIAAGLEQVLEQKQYKTLLVSRPVQPLGKDIGFLPGTKEEKMEPWIAPIKDNLRFLLSNKGDVKSGKGDKKAAKAETTLDYFFLHGIIEVEAMTYIRGRSISDAYMIIDEAQNLTAHELKTIITRVGENTKIVLTGDIEQIDNLYVDSVSNGLTVAVEKFKGSDLAGHITLVKGERSKLASLAADLL